MGYLICYRCGRLHITRGHIASDPPPWFDICDEQTRLHKAVTAGQRTKAQGDRVRNWAESSEIPRVKLAAAVLGIEAKRPPLYPLRGVEYVPIILNRYVSPDTMWWDG